MTKYAYEKTGSSWQLIEATEKEVEAAKRSGKDIISVSAREAHDWVRRGRLHMTGLYTDGNRIRYAKGE